MEDSDITAALGVISAVGEGERIWGTIAGNTQAEVLPRIVENYTSRPEVRCHVVAMADGEHAIQDHCLTMAITGNGPTAEAHAKYIVASFDPVAGWEAALREVSRLRAMLVEIRNAPARHA